MSSSSSSAVHLVRQPVFDPAASVVGYELRYRDVGGGGDPLVRSCLSGAVDDLRGGLPAWVYPNWVDLNEETFGFVDPRSLHMMLPREIIADGAYVERVAALSRRGVTIVIDDFDAEQGETSSQAEFLQHAEIVRLDLRVHDVGSVAPIMKDLRARRKRVAADHVVDAKAYRACREAGFEMLQGPHFAHPEPLPQADLPISTVTALRVMAMARNTDIPERDIELAISADPAIVLQLLRIVNSASVGGRGITSISHALRLSGRDKLARWLSLVACASPSGSSGLATELTRQAVQRAFFSEALARRSVGRDAGAAFLVGLFSLFDAVFRMPLSDIIARVNLADEVRDALLDRSGPCADTLALIEAYELGLWESAGAAADELNIDAATLPEIYAASLTAAREVVP